MRFCGSEKKMSSNVPSLLVPDSSLVKPLEPAPLSPTSCACAHLKLSPRLCFPPVCLTWGRWLRAVRELRLKLQGLTLTNEAVGGAQKENPRSRRLVQSSCPTIRSAW